MIMTPPVSGMCMGSVRGFQGMDWAWAKALRPARLWTYNIKLIKPGSYVKYI